ncbi:hypothetical protein [Borborobacter arsenicus]|uniref:hypothetical protein n=1 Tax=Borborobacter arsenicus TaxID=1851146 RepID=UPI001AECDA10|nr:hypothetical protein [Pseudaminobacter arsenicus]
MAATAAPNPLSIFTAIIPGAQLASALPRAILPPEPTPYSRPRNGFLGVEWKFVKAVGVDDEIIGRVEVTEVRGDKPIRKLATSVRNAAGEICLTGTATVYTVPLVKD